MFPRAAIGPCFLSRRVAVSVWFCTFVFTVAGAAQTLPSGHPAIAPRTDAPAMTLPAGHPRLGPAATAPAVKADYGTITLHVIQGSKDAPPVAGDAVTVELFRDGQVTGKYDVQLDSNGRATVGRIPLQAPFEPLITIKHAGLDQQASGPAMDASNPTLELELKVFEPTDATPAWSVNMRHIMIQTTPEGLQVMEMLSVQNPTDRVWMGAKDDPRGRVALALDLPEGAQDVAPGNGFVDERTQVSAGKLITMGPLFPGSTQYQVAYTIPARGGAADLRIVAPAAVEHMMVFLPANAAQAKGDGLESLGDMEMEQYKVRVFKATALKAGQVATLQVTGLAALPRLSASHGLAASPGMARNIAAVGVGVVVLVGAGIMMLKRPKPKAGA